MSRVDRQKKKRKTKKIRKFSRFIYLISLIVLAVFIYALLTLNILPEKYLYLVIGALVFFNLIYAILCFKKNIKGGILIFADLLAILCSGALAYAALHLTGANTGLENLFVKYENNIYNVVVNKNSKYTKLSDIKGLEVDAYNDLEDANKLEEAINNEVSVKYKESDDIAKLLDSVKTDKNKIILVNSGNYEAMLDIDQDYSKVTKVIGSINIKTKLEKSDTNINVTRDSFIMYLSGIDTRKNALPARSLSDVNIVAVINPRVKKVLLVNVPRDYYVNLYGTTGLKDKLTHAGSTGGVKLSMKTIEQLLDIKINHYTRVNFNSVIKVVNAVDGIDLYNDQNKTFTCWTDRSCKFKPGMNHVMGKCALAFARERHAYQSGDKHRGENQQQVIQKVLEKLSISNYQNVLNSMSGTMESSLSKDDITNLVKLQLEDDNGWKIESANLDGTTGSEVTRSTPNQKLSVMYPDKKSIENAKIKIDEMLKEK